MRLSVACARAGEREALLDARDRPTVRVSRAAVDALTRGTHAGRRSAGTHHAVCLSRRLFGDGNLSPALIFSPASLIFSPAMHASY